MRMRLSLFRSSCKYSRLQLELLAKMTILFLVLFLVLLANFISASVTVSYQDHNPEGPPRHGLRLPHCLQHFEYPRDDKGIRPGASPT